MSIQPAHTSIEKIKVYQPGMPIETLAERTGLSHILKLASNENAQGPSEKVLESWASASHELPYYPEAGASRLKAAVSEKLQVPTSQLIMGSGSEEIIHLLFQYLCKEGDGVIIPTATFPAYAIHTHAVGATIQSVENNNNNHAVDLPAILEAITPKTRLICLANPNNPTGLYWAPKVLKEWLSAVPRDIVVLLDEAYYEYVTREHQTEAHHWIGEFPNLVVTRSFSKMYALAALRVGYGIAHPDLIQNLHRIKMPFNVNRVAQKMAEIALQDEAHVDHCYHLNQKDRTELAQKLVDLGFKPLVSEANFLCVPVGDKTDEIEQGFLERGIIVRNLKGFGMPGFLRITVGTESENEKCLSVLEKIME